MEQPYKLPILCCQNHACWCPGDLSQGISRIGIDQISWNILSLTSEELIVPFYGHSLQKCLKLIGCQVAPGN